MLFSISFLTFQLYLELQDAKREDPLYTFYALFDPLYGTGVGEMRHQIDAPASPCASSRAISRAS